MHRAATIITVAGLTATLALLDAAGALPVRHLQTPHPPPWLPTLILVALPTAAAARALWELYRRRR